MSTVLFWQLFCLCLFAALFVVFYIVYKLENRNKPIRHKDLVDYSPGEQNGHIRRYADHGLHGSNRDRSESAFHDWH